MRLKKLGIILAGVMGSLLLGTTVYAESYGTVNAAALNARHAPFEFSSITSVYKEEEAVKIIDQAIPGWFKVETNSGKTSYVSTAYVDVVKVKATINGDGVNSRTLPEEDARINRQLYEGEEVSVYCTIGDWYYIGLASEEFYGFVHSDYVDGDLFYFLPEKDASEVEEIEIKIIEEVEEVIKEESTTSTTSASQPASSGKSGGVVGYAKQFVGNPYVYGGSSLTNGTDCSGFTQQVMKNAGVSLQRSSSAQYANNGVKVSADSAQPGDLMFYGYNGKVSHVGIYIGGGQMVHASSSKTGIIISNAYRTSGKPLIGVKRVL